MKKYALIFTVFLIAFFSICGYNDYVSANSTISDAEKIENFAENREITVEDLKQAAFENPKVKKVEAYIYGDSAVIAIRCDAVFFRSENLAICGEIKKKVEKKGFREVYATKDTDIFFKISEMEKTYKKNGNASEYAKTKESILKKVRERIY
jgi:catabolite regulation protein CreA